MMFDAVSSLAFPTTSEPSLLPVTYIWPSGDIAIASICVQYGHRRANHVGKDTLLRARSHTKLETFTYAFGHQVSVYLLWEPHQRFWDIECGTRDVKGCLYSRGDGESAPLLNHRYTHGISVKDSRSSQRPC